jgi:hypothetical protein
MDALHRRNTAAEATGHKPGTFDNPEGDRSIPGSTNGFFRLAVLCFFRCYCFGV